MAGGDASATVSVSRKRRLEPTADDVLLVISLSVCLSVCLYVFVCLFSVSVSLTVCFSVTDTYC